MKVRHEVDPDLRSLVIRGPFPPFPGLGVSDHVPGLILKNEKRVFRQPVFPRVAQIARPDVF